MRYARLKLQENASAWQKQLNLQQRNCCIRVHVNHSALREIEKNNQMLLNGELLKRFHITWAVPPVSSFSRPI